MAEFLYTMDPLCTCICPKPNLDTSPKSEPALELISRVEPSVEAHHRSVGPDAGRKFWRKADD